MLSQVEHKVKISHCRHVCNWWLTNHISYMTSYSYACDVSVPNFTCLAPIVHSSSPRTRVSYQKFLTPPYNFIFHHSSRKNIKRLQSALSKFPKRELDVTNTYTHETIRYLRSTRTCHKSKIKLTRKHAM
jgi:hypothetical protein